MSRAPALPAKDCLLTRRQCARLLGMAPGYWPGYYKRFTRLVAGRRYRAARAGTRGRPMWLRSALVAHMHLDLVSHREGGEVLPPAAAARRPELQEATS